jgi:hypothetical protein
MLSDNITKLLSSVYANHLFKKLLLLTQKLYHLRQYRFQYYHDDPMLINTTLINNPNILEIIL